MNNKIAAFSLASVFLIATPFALAVEKTAEGSAPPSAIPGLNRSNNSESKEDKADKKGEEASGSNSGADSEATEKDAAGSSDSSDSKGEQRQ